MTKTELESKHLSELHALAAEANVPQYRMLRREELIEKLADGGASTEKPRERREARPRRERKPRERSEGLRRREPRKRRERPDREERGQQEPEPISEKSPAPPPPPTPAAEERPRRRRRRRFGRKRKGLRLLDLATAGGGRQTIVYAETREGCTKILRELAAEISGESNGSDPIALLVDPGPEELADWRREAPDAEIVAAAQPRHADDAIAQAVRRAQGGESVVVLVDSLTRLTELGDADAATELLGAASGVTVVAALEHS